MTRKIIAIILTLAMVLSLGPVIAMADGAPAARPVMDKLELYFDNLDIEKNFPIERAIEVEADVLVKEETTAWEDATDYVLIREKNTGGIPTFDYKATMDLAPVKTAFDSYTTLGGLAGATTDELNNLRVVGEFIITIDLPVSNFEIPAAIEDGSNMDGFDDATKEIFNEVSREIVGDVATIKIGVDKSKAELDTYFATNPVITFICEDIQPTNFGIYTVEVGFTGETDIMENAGVLGTISYVLEENPEATIEIKKKSSGDGGGGGADSQIIRLEYMDGEEVVHTVKEVNKIVSDTTTITPPEKEGYKFAGWYLDKELTKKAEDVVETTKSMKLYAKWIDEEHVLEKDDHFAYIIGYVDGTVKPQNNITRQEVAAIFFRLLTEEAGESIHADVAPYSDVPATKWSSTAIATLTKGGYITGCGDGTFKPEQNITRAEFATIAARFSSTAYVNDIHFDDAHGHWAESFIEECAAKGWITGYEDGTFKPDQYITRSEAMAIVNRMLDRAVTAEGLKNATGEIVKFSDHIEGTWDYYIVLEATNSHNYVRHEVDGHEEWTEITDPRDWTVYEK